MPAPFIHRERVRFGDLDAMRHLNNVVYLRYFEMRADRLHVGALAGPQPVQPRARLVWPDLRRGAHQLPLPRAVRRGGRGASARSPRCAARPSGWTSRCTWASGSPPRATAGWWGSTTGSRRRSPCPRSCASALESATNLRRPVRGDWRPMKARTLLALLVAAAVLWRPGQRPRRRGAAEPGLADASSLQGRAALVVRLAAPAARPGEAPGPQIGIGFRWLPARRPARHPRSWRWRAARVPVHRQPLRVHGHLRPAAARARPAARGQPRHRPLGADRLQVAASLPGRDARGRPSPARWRPARERSSGATAPRRPSVHAADLFATAYAARGPRRGAPRARAAARSTCTATPTAPASCSPSSPASGPPAFGGARLHLPGPRPRPLVRVVGRGGTAGHDAVCARDAGCAAAAPGSADGRLGAAADAAAAGADRRARPATPTGAGVRPRFGIRALVDMVQDAGSDPVIYRELDASVRAALAGDDAPLLRLVAQSKTTTTAPSTADYFSDGLYFAVSCMDYPQLFSMHSPPRDRRDAAGRAPRRRRPAPSTRSRPEWFTMSAYSEPYARLPRLAAARPCRADRARRRSRRCRPPYRCSSSAATSTRSRRCPTPRCSARPSPSARAIVTLRNTVHVTSRGRHDCSRRRGLRPAA